MIILAGEAEFQGKTKKILIDKGYVEDTLIVNFHAKGMMPAAGSGDLAGWLTNHAALIVEKFSERMDKTPVSGYEWRNRIAELNKNTGGRWFIHDFRVIWFLDDFIKEAGEVKIIALLSEESDYLRLVGRFLKDRIPETLPVLKAAKPPTSAQIEKLITGGSG